MSATRRNLGRGIRAAAVAAVVVGALSALAAGAETVRPVGFRGDGSGAFPSAHPVLSWDEGTGRNVLWRTPMPSWSHASPVVVGNRVVVLAEPNQVLCLDARTGQVLWLRVCDQLELFLPADAAPARKAWQCEVRRNREAKDVIAELVFVRTRLQQLAAARAGRTRTAERLLGPACPADLEEIVLDLEADEADLVARKEALEARAKERALLTRYGLRGWRGYYVTRASEAFGAAREVRERLHHDFGLHFEQWGGYVGQTFATPVSDGRHVYVTFGFGQVACYDLEGERQWLTWFRPVPHRAGGKGDGEADLPLRVGCRYTNSPLLAGGRLIVIADCTVRALDPATGKEVWRERFPWRHSARQGQEPAGSPVLATVAGREVVVTSHGRAYAPEDGRVLTSKLPRCIATPLALGDRIVFVPNGRERDGRPGCKVEAVRLAWDGLDALVTETLWTHRDRGAFYHAPVHDRGRLYVRPAGRRLLVLNAADGTLLEEPLEGMDPERLPLTGFGPNPILAGKYLVVPDGTGAVATLRTGPPCRLVALSRVRSEVKEAMAHGDLPFEEVRRRWFSRDLYPWRFHLVASPVADGDRLFLRTHEHVLCIGRGFQASNE